MRRRIMVLFVTLAVSLLAVAPAMAAPAPSLSPSAVAAPGYHVVRPGETLFSIGRLYGVSPWAIAHANHLIDPNRIFIGQCLYIPPRTCYYAWSGCGYYYGGCGYTRCR